MHRPGKIGTYVFPFPAKDFITIRINNVLVEELATLRIINILGKVVMTDKLSLKEGSTSFTQNISN